MEAEAELARGLKVPQICKKLEVTEQPYHRRRKEYGGLWMDEAKRLKDLEHRNARLKKLLAEAELDKPIPSFSNAPATRCSTSRNCPGPGFSIGTS